VLAKSSSDAIGSSCLFRLPPATLDLILTKMMRGEDSQDMEDRAFLIQHDRITAV